MGIVGAMACAGWRPIAAQEARLEGDPRALASVEQLLAGLGGAGAWARSRTIAVELRGYYATDSALWNETYWIDLAEPRGRYEIRAGTSRRVIAWTTAGGWESRDGVVQDQSPERHSLEQAYWTSELTVLFRRLAARTPKTAVTLDSASGVRTITVLDASTGDSLARLTLNASHEPIRWSARINGESFDRVLGPLAPYGPIRLPRWGATPSGVWRYEHLRVSLSREPPPVSFRRPP
jgi:hypothetical protein